MATEHPSHEAIAERAYFRFEARGGAEGFQLDDWLQAERELREMRTAAHTATGFQLGDEPREKEKEEDGEEATPARRVGLRKAYPRRAAG